MKQLIMTIFTYFVPQKLLQIKVCFPAIDKLFRCYLIKVSNIFLNTFILSSIVLNTNFIIILRIYMRISRLIDSIPMLEPYFIPLFYHIVGKVTDLNKSDELRSC